MLKLYLALTVLTTLSGCSGYQPREAGDLLASRAGAPVDTSGRGTIQELVFLHLLQLQDAKQVTYCLTLADSSGLQEIPAAVLDRIAARGYGVRQYPYCHDVWRSAASGVAQPLLFELRSEHREGDQVRVKFARSSAQSFRDPLGLGAVGGHCVLRKVNDQWELSECRYDWVS